jgi:DNA-binding CsgD family transcriptional regulator
MWLQHLAGTALQDAEERIHAVHQALKRLYRKLGVRSRAAAVAPAASWNVR